MTVARGALSAGFRRLSRFVLWTVGPDPDGDEIHLVYCEGEAEDGTRCGATSGEWTDREAAELFVFDHATEFPDHRSYGRLSDHRLIAIPTEEPT